MKILGYEYKLSPKKKLVSLGSINETKLKIKIDKNLVAAQLYSTILHEVIHALSYHLHLDLSENQVMGLEAGLYQTLTDCGVDLSPLAKELEK